MLCIRLGPPVPAAQQVKACVCGMTGPSIQYGYHWLGQYQRLSYSTARHNTVCGCFRDMYVQGAWMVGTGWGDNTLGGGSSTGRKAAAQWGGSGSGQWRMDQHRCRCCRPEPTWPDFTSYWMMRISLVVCRPAALAVLHGVRLPMKTRRSVN